MCGSATLVTLVSTICITVTGMTEKVDRHLRAVTFRGRRGAITQADRDDADIPRAAAAGSRPPSARAGSYRDALHHLHPVTVRSRGRQQGEPRAGAGADGVHLAVEDLAREAVDLRRRPACRMHAPELVSLTVSRAPTPRAAARSRAGDDPVVPPAQLDGALGDHPSTGARTVRVGELQLRIASSACVCFSVASARATSACFTVPAAALGARDGAATPPPPSACPSTAWQLGEASSPAPAAPPAVWASRRRATSCMATALSVRLRVVVLAARDVVILHEPLHALELQGPSCARWIRGGHSRRPRPRRSAAPRAARATPRRWPRRIFTDTCEPRGWRAPRPSVRA